MRVNLLAQENNGLPLNYITFIQRIIIACIYVSDLYNIKQFLITNHFSLIQRKATVTRVLLKTEYIYFLNKKNVNLYFLSSLISINILILYNNL